MKDVKSQRHKDAKYFFALRLCIIVLNYALCIVNYELKK